MYEDGNPLILKNRVLVETVTSSKKLSLHCWRNSNSVSGMQCNCLREDLNICCPNFWVRVSWKKANDWCKTPRRNWSIDSKWERAERSHDLEIGTRVRTITSVKSFVYRKKRLNRWINLNLNEKLPFAHICHHSGRENWRLFPHFRSEPFQHEMMKFINPFLKIPKFCACLQLNSFKKFPIFTSSMIDYEKI